MLNSEEAAFLRSIAEKHDDDAPRLIFADWLDEHDQGPRAEFIRVQCELASAKVAKKRRQELRLRERTLLDAHRQEWCEAHGLPVEDVTFARGLIDKMRLVRWDKKLLDPAYGPRFATLTELDLSGLEVDDNDVKEFAQKAYLPELRKLMLNNNTITNVGAKALATAEWLPKLNTLYLFGNKIEEPGYNALDQSKHFKLQDLDNGDREDGYALTPGEAEMARRQYVREHLVPMVGKYFKKYERLQSAMLCVAQYWADEADDAVHAMLIVSELFEPTLEGVREYDDDGKPNIDPNILNTPIIPKYSQNPSSAVSLWEAGVPWDDNSGAIPLWAAFAPEEGSQEYEYLKETYQPAVLFYRHGSYEILPMTRPHLDGVRPEWGEDD